MRTASNRIGRVRRRAVTLVAVIVGLALVTACVDTPQEEDSGSSPAVEATSSPSVEESPEPYFHATEDLDPCPSAEDIAGLDSFDHDGSVDYETSVDLVGVNYTHRFLCRVSPVPGAAGAAPTSDVLTMRTDLSVGAPVYDRPGTDEPPTLAPPPYFADWDVEYLNVTVEEVEYGSCFNDNDWLDLCEDGSTTQLVWVGFIGTYENLLLDVELDLRTVDADRDLESWAVATVTEVAEAMVERIPAQ